MKPRIKYIPFVFLLSLALLCGCRAVPSEEAQSTEEAKGRIVYPEPDGRMVVMIDAGHGFRDIGCDTELLLGTEADVTLDMAKRLARDLEGKGVTVILTHDGESFPDCDEIKELAEGEGIEYDGEKLLENDIFSAYERAVYSSAVAKKENVDLFVSLHVNSIANNPSVSRFEIDYYRDNPYASSLRVFSESLADSLSGETVIYADPLDKAFLVTKTGAHPSVLIEMGYATNESDSANLNSDEWRKSFSEGLSQRIFEWIDTYE